jgi:hypothetical protein
MKTGKVGGLGVLITIVSFFCISLVCFAAYHHMGEMDSGIFLSVYPEKAGTKLDNCNLCHSGGSYINNKGNTITLGSCQWCHYSYGYDGLGDIEKTLNPYGVDYRDYGRNLNAIASIAVLDSDNDGFSNGDEIAANRYPGDPGDDPAKVPAPSRVYTRTELENTMPQHTQFLLMNTHKSGDFYAQYSGVAMDYLLQKLILPEATGITVYAADGWATDHPLYLDPNPALYHVFGDYPQAFFQYDQEADQEKTSYGWCDYSSIYAEGRSHGDPIVNPDGQKLLLAFKRDDGYLIPGELNSSNKLDGEGPYRVVPPQKIPGPPDQGSTSKYQDVIWPFDPTDTITDHNAGFSSKSVTMIKVLPLPEGTTDVDTLEAGWPYIDSEKIVVYGAIDPIPGVKEKLSQLMVIISGLPQTDFKQPSAQEVLYQKLEVIQKQVDKGNYKGALQKLQSDILSKVDGCRSGDVAEKDDWVKNCENGKQIYWAVNEIMVLLKIVA